MRASACGLTPVVTCARACVLCVCVSVLCVRVRVRVRVRVMRWQSSVLVRHVRACVRYPQGRASSRLRARARTFRKICAMPWHSECGSNDAAKPTTESN
jgi:hypothetical protein